MALIGRSEYVEHANLVEPIENPNQLDAAIDRATKIIEQLTGREFYAGLSPMEVVEVFNGTGTFRYFTREAPLVTADTLEYWTGTEWRDVTEDGLSFSFDAVTGEVYFPERDTFHAGTENWRVTYTYGDDEYPEDLKYVCCLLVGHIIHMSKFSNLRSQSDGEQNFSYDHTVPAEVSDVCDKYKRY
jgi:hypothetical protein